MRAHAFAVLAAAAILALPASSYAQDSLAVYLAETDPYHYRDAQGHTIVVGQVVNQQNFPVTGISLRASFYDAAGLQPLETESGSAAIDVIPPESSAPYSIRSPSPNAAITDASVSLLAFNSAVPKGADLEIAKESIDALSGFSYAAEIKNNAAKPAQNVRAYAAFYDAFDPPQLIQVEEVSVPLPIPPGGSAAIEISSALPEKAALVSVAAESDASYAEKSSSRIIRASGSPAARITVHDIGLIDAGGQSVAHGVVGQPVMVGSTLGINPAPGFAGYGQDYNYFIQVKQFGPEAHVEYVSVQAGAFDGPGTQQASVPWAPSSPGSYFVEAYVWDPDGVALALSSPITLVQIQPAG